MTNEFGSDQHEGHEHDPAAQEAGAHEAEPGVWTDDQPPHDDFGSANEEMATVSQEAATETEVDDTAPVEARNSRSMLPILAGIGGILLLGGVIYFQFGRSSSAPQMHMAAPSAPAAQQAAAVPPASPPPPSDSATPPASASADIDSLYKPAGTVGSAIGTPPTTPQIQTNPSPLQTTQQAAPPASNTTASADHVAALPPTTAPVAAAAPEVTAPVAPTVPLSPPPVQANPVNPVPPLPNQILHPANNVPANPQPGQAQIPGMKFNPAATAESQTDMARVNAMMNRLDTMQKSLEDQNRQVNQMNNVVAANQMQATGNPGARTGNGTDIENRLNRIEQTLLKLESDQSRLATGKAAAKPKVEAPVMAAASELPADSTYVQSEATPKPSKSRHAATTHKKSSSSSTRHKSSPKPTAFKTVSEKSNWVLRAATPKEAWVASDANSPELRHVQVGDNLPGLGMIQSIRQTSTGWEVLGSSGVLH